MDTDTLNLAAFELERMGYTKAAFTLRQMAEKQGDPVGYAAGYQDGRKDLKAEIVELLTTHRLFLSIDTINGHLS
jgi:hypothetical protein